MNLDSMGMKSIQKDRAAAKAAGADREMRLGAEDATGGEEMTRAAERQRRNAEYALKLEQINVRIAEAEAKAAEKGPLASVHGKILAELKNERETILDEFMGSADPDREGSGQ